MPDMHEQFRPKTWSEFIGQTKAVDRVRAIIDRPGFDGSAIWFEGGSGSGKSTAAWIIARQFCDPWNIHKVDSKDCNLEAVRDITDRARSGFIHDKPMQCWIIEEAHTMTAAAVQAWLTALDPRPANLIVVFTTTEPRADLFGEFNKPFFSRCKVIQFTNQGQAELIAASIRAKLAEQGRDGHDPAAYLKIVRASGNNWRDSWQRVECGELEGVS